jgi:hypothetical protein
MTIESATGTEFLHIVISLGLLLFAAKIFAELFARLKLPIVLGELVAGIIVGPIPKPRLLSWLLQLQLLLLSGLRQYIRKRNIYPKEETLRSFFRTMLDQLMSSRYDFPYGESSPWLRVG